jgi:hypothetical protein
VRVSVHISLTYASLVASLGRSLLRWKKMSAACLELTNHVQKPARGPPGEALTEKVSSMLRFRYFVVPDQPTAMRATGLQINDRTRDSAEFQATSVLCLRKQRRARQTLDSSILRSLRRRFNVTQVSKLLHDQGYSVYVPIPNHSSHMSFYVGYNTAVTKHLRQLPLRTRRSNRTHS